MVYNQDMISTKIVITKFLEKLRKGCGVVVHERLTEPRVTMK